MTTIMKIFYRPTENHVGVIYSRWGKFNRFAQPNQWTVLSSAFESVAKEIKLDTRTAKITLHDVLTRDKVAINFDMNIVYTVDVRQIHMDRMSQVLRFGSESAWEEIVKTGVTDIARNVVVISHRYEDLATPGGLAYLKRALSTELAHRVRPFGILMNRFGVSINWFALSVMTLQQNDVITFRNRPELIFESYFKHANLDSTIFISYARSDLEKVNPIYYLLQDEGYNAWLDVHDIKGGENWLRSIYHAINESEIFIAILSKNSVNRRGVIQQELKKALDKWEGMLPDDIYIIPVRIDDCPIPEMLNKLHVLDWNSENSQSKLITAIQEGLKRRVR